MDPLNSPEKLSILFINQIKGYAIFTTDKNGIITSWNEGAERVKGYTEEEIIGQFYGILHPDEYQQAGKPEEELAIALEKGIFENEDWRRRKDGSLFWASVVLTPIFSDAGEHVGFTKVTGDITKQKELQDKLAERQQSALEHKNTELQRINSDLDNFIYTASHDLRSPITNIEGLIGYLKEELSEMSCMNEETEEILQRVESSVDRFKHTIEDLTEISRLQKNLSESASDEIINVQEVYEDILADMGYPTKENGIFIETHFEVHQLKFSKKNFRSVLFNLISNSLKYRSPDRDLVINIHTRLEEPYVRLSVQDNGLGIHKRHHQQLFTMFKRFHDHVQGTGVGLYMVKRIVENAGGRIEVESNEGDGSKFILYLKAAV
ncbi:PAS domain-containing sensor histidine kinase [uncultured Pontibacter sp.]|uniref:sensor histidine kinase n=1 Tax=uncultured Pontibacter sp. TaxID=453356 RepID=UPI00260B814B|nr:PAS domain-containing sensor histidine kinase [uncultured Pontibacter sp.]